MSSTRSDKAYKELTGNSIIRVNLKPDTHPPSRVGGVSTNGDLHVEASLSLSRPLLEGIAQVGRTRSKTLQNA